ncbi:unnamed protein product [Ilex paraguariensis]|uniref:Uncharacterized protein n=1 Tax=Ilex paraguariensis TaxID=185542 RepID=A0ABC8UIF6_9AQUA
MLIGLVLKSDPSMTCIPQKKMNDHSLLQKVTLSGVETKCNPYHMRGTSFLLAAAKYKFKPIFSVEGAWGTMATTMSKKQANTNAGEEGQIAKDKADPIVAFSRPPPVPPVLGPLVALTLLETWSSRDSSDD